MVDVLLVGTIIVGFGLGLMLLPGYIRLMGPGVFPKGALGKGMFILGQIAQGGSFAYVRDNGSLELWPFDNERNRVWVDGEWQDIKTETDDTQVYRLGWRPLAIGWEKTNEMLGSYGVDDEDVSTSAVTDGGDAALLDEQYGGIPAWTAWPNGADEDSILVHAQRFVNAMGRSGNRLINRAEEVALRKFGGANETSELKFAMLLVGCVIIMFVTTWVMLSL